MNPESEWNRFMATGKIADYLQYRKACADVYTTLEGTQHHAIQNGRDCHPTAKNQ